MTDDLPFMDEGDAVRDGMWRRVFNDVVTFQPDYIFYDKSIDEWDYAVEKYPFVPGFHVVEINQMDDMLQDRVLSSHKTLAEAMSICKVLLANGGVHRG